MTEAYRAGMSKRALGRMSVNIAVEVLLGSVPIIGDAFDVYWKSNMRNAAILEKYLLELTHEEKSGFH